MAAGACRRYSGMIHDGRAAKAHRTLVAISAGRRGDHVVGRLSECDRTIVTADADSSRLGMVNEAHLPPRRRQVAALAKIGGLRMRRRFAGSRRSVVAGKTLPRRSLKAAVDVARCAVDAGVRTRERKSRREMIE